MSLMTLLGWGGVMTPSGFALKDIKRTGQMVFVLFRTHLRGLVTDVSRVYRPARTSGAIHPYPVGDFQSPWQPDIGEITTEKCVLPRAVVSAHTTIVRLSTHGEIRCTTSTCGEVVFLFRLPAAFLSLPPTPQAPPLTGTGRPIFRVCAPTPKKRFRRRSHRLFPPPPGVPVYSLST